MGELTEKEYAEETAYRLTERLGISFGAREVTAEEMERTKEEVEGEIKDLANKNYDQTKHLHSETGV